MELTALSSRNGRAVQLFEVLFFTP